MTAKAIEDESGRWLSAAAVQSVLEGAVKTLFPRIAELASGAADELVRETADGALESI